MQEKGKVVNTFRLFFDLQGYSLKEIPENFLFDHCVKFYLTEKNNEDMEGFNDVWANILNDDILNAKDLLAGPVLEQPSELKRMNLNLESNIVDASMESLIPRLESSDTHLKSSERILQNLEEEKEPLSDDTMMLPVRLEESDFNAGSGREIRSLRGKERRDMSGVSSIVKESDIDSIESKIENLWHHLPKNKRRHR